MEILIIIIVGIMFAAWLCREVEAALSLPVLALLIGLLLYALSDLHVGLGG